VTIAPSRPHQRDVAASSPSPDGLPTFDEVYERYLPFVWRSLAALGVPEWRLEDAAQDVFVAVHAGLRGFEGRSRITTWLYGIARNVAHEHIRRRIRERREADELARVPAPPVETPEDEARATESRRILLEILAELEPEKREVLALVDIEQIPVKDVAEMIGAKENTVWSRLRLARREFQAHVARLQARSKERQR
jgi:RNA polymerase sigma-70 factor, ECF subfamily